VARKSLKGKTVVMGELTGNVLAGYADDYCRVKWSKGLVTLAWGPSLLVVEGK
jgi:hypothetical protein